MAKPADFAKRMNKIAANIRANTDKGWKATALLITQTVISATPVDTGRARANWQVGDGKAPSGTRNAFSPGKGGSSAGANTSAAVQEARSRIEASKSSTLYVSNNLPYIVPLNEGHSAQAPAGFVETAVNAGIAYAKKLKLLKDA